MASDADNSGFGWMRLLSALSGWTLALCGGISLAISVAFLSWVGIAMGAALLAHGIVELRLRRKFFGPGGAPAARAMGWNQIALAATITAYAAFQYAQFDAEAFAQALQSDSVGQLSQLYGVDLAATLQEKGPRLIAAFYLAVAGAAWFGCFLTALCYWRAGQRRLEREASASSLGRGSG